MLTSLTGFLSAPSALPASLVPTATDDTADAAVEATLDVLSLAWHAALGLGIGIVIAFVLVVVGRAAGRRRVLWIEVTRYCRNALYATAALLGAYLGAQVAVIDLSTPTWTSVVMRVLLVSVILAFTWLVVGLAKAVEATIVDHVREGADEGRANRVTTQTQILRRVAEVIIVACGVVGAVMTFPSARVAMGSLLASAGLVSVIAGLAAQSTLGNVFAGLQLATTDAIRVDDTVVVEGEQGTIEEITLTYVVVRVWDDRRLILPSKYFTENPFANWSRRGTQVTGNLSMVLDWRVPVAALRAQLAHVVAASSLWDGRIASLDVTDTSTSLVTVRILVSGANAGDVFSLKCHIQEELVGWLQTEAPYALPRTRVELEEVEVLSDPTPEKVARLAEELTRLAAPGVPDDVTDPDAVAVSEDGDPVEAAKVRAAARRSSSARRRQRERRRRHRGEILHARQSPERTRQQSTSTQVISTAERELLLTEVEAAPEEHTEPAPAREERTEPASAPEERTEPVPAREERTEPASAREERTEPASAREERTEELRRTSIIAKVEAEAAREHAANGEVSDDPTPTQRL